MSAVLGHDETHRRFHRQMASGRLHHAWLLHGPEGIGKRMLARSLAADYLCRGNSQSNGVDDIKSACGVCHDCRMMAAGSHPDFLLIEREFDEKKKRLKRDVHIGQVRKLLGFLSLSGAESARRVALIGEAGRMNTQTANAMLKGLEEPAAGSLLLLVCEDALLLPATVRSRCLLQYLSPLPETVMRTLLSDMQVSEQAMPLALRLADGQPGRVMALTEVDVVDALLSWHGLFAAPESFDVGKVQQWIIRHVAHVPHGLIVDTLLDALKPMFMAQSDTLCAEFSSPDAAIPAMQCFDTALDAARNLAAWPAEVRRRTLRPAPTLLAHILSLRIALRDIKKAA